MRRSKRGPLCRIFPGLVVVAAMFWAVPAHAQNWGAKGGLNLSTLTLEGVETSGKAGAVVGGFIHFPLVAGLRVQVEGLFTQRRITFEENVRDDVDFFELPVLARYRVFTVGGRPVHVLGGGVIGFRLAAHEVFGGESVDVKEAYEAIDLGAAIGGEVAVTRHWRVDVRYVFGLSNAFDIPGIDAKFRALQITAGYGF